MPLKLCSTLYALNVKQSLSRLFDETLPVASFVDELSFKKNRSLPIKASKAHNFRVKFFSGQKLVEMNKLY